VIGEVIQEEGLRFGRPLDRLVKADRMEIIKALQRRGVLSLRRAAPQVADHLGLSRATFYAYLREIKDGNGAQPASGDEGDADEQ
jgi:predicted transcriptional regulator YheO